MIATFLVPHSKFEVASFSDVLDEDFSKNELEVRCVEQSETTVKSELMRCSDEMTGSSDKGHFADATWAKSFSGVTEEPWEFCANSVHALTIDMCFAI